MILVVVGGWEAEGNDDDDEPVEDRGGDDGREDSEGWQVSRAAVMRDQTKAVRASLVDTHSTGSWDWDCFSPPALMRVVLSDSTVAPRGSEASCFNFTSCSRVKRT